MSRGKKLPTEYKGTTQTAQIPGVFYKGTGKDPAVEALKDKLKKDGADSLNSSGFGNRWKV